MRGIVKQHLSLSQLEQLPLLLELLFNETMLRLPLCAVGFTHESSAMGLVLVVCVSRGVSRCDV